MISNFKLFPTPHLKKERKTLEHDADITLAVEGVAGPLLDVVGWTGARRSWHRARSLPDLTSPAAGCRT